MWNYYPLSHIPQTPENVSVYFSISEKEFSSKYQITFLYQRIGLLALLYTLLFLVTQVTVFVANNGVDIASNCIWSPLIQPLKRALQNVTEATNCN